MDLVSLKNEIQTDPESIGYAAVITDHPAIARLLNQLQRVVDVETLSSGVLVSCLDKTEFSALTAADKNYLNLFVTAGEVQMSQVVKLALRELFPAQSATRAAIMNATRRTGSRAEELGLGQVTESDVADALLRT